MQSALPYEASFVPRYDSHLAHPMKIKLTLLSLTVAKVKKNGHLAEDRQVRNREKAKIYRYQ